MEANELRLGNLILLNNEKHRPKETGSVHKIIGINEKSAHIYKVFNNPFEDYYSQFYEYLKPIPLTEEWLEKFWFIDFEKESFSCYIENNGEIVFKKGGLDILYDYPIQYVHQLQNLYFALTGEELSLKN